MTLQEMFQTASTRLLAQGAKSQRPDGMTCVYFSDSGNCCAVGLLLKDSPEIKAEILEKGLNRAPLTDLLISSPRAREFLGESAEGEICGFLVDLQAIHDNCPIVDWPAELLNLGERFKLDTSFLTTQAA